MKISYGTIVFGITFLVFFLVAIIVWKFFNLTFFALSALFIAMLALILTLWGKEIVAFVFKKTKATKVPPPVSIPAKTGERNRAVLWISILAVTVLFFFGLTVVIVYTLPKFLLGNTEGEISTTQIVVALIFLVIIIFIGNALPKIGKEETSEEKEIEDPTEETAKKTKKEPKASLVGLIGCLVILALIITPIYYLYNFITTKSADEKNSFVQIEKDSTTKEPITPPWGIQKYTVEFTSPQEVNIPLGYNIDFQCEEPCDNIVTDRNGRTHRIFGVLSGEDCKGKLDSSVKDIITKTKFVSSNGNDPVRIRLVFTRDN